MGHCQLLISSIPLYCGHIGSLEGILYSRMVYAKLPPLIHFLVVVRYVYVHEVILRKEFPHECGGVIMGYPGDCSCLCTCYPMYAPARGGGKQDRGIVMEAKFRYDEDFERKIEAYQAEGDDEPRPLFVLVYQHTYPDKTVFVGPWDRNEFEFTETEVIIRDGDFVFQRDMISGFFEIQPSAPMDWNSYDHTIGPA